MFSISEILKPYFPIQALQEVKPPLEALYYQGNIELLKGKLFAVVGGRLASTYGRRAAIQFAKELSDAGFVVVSGLARGIDGAAHYGSLLGKTPTIAVLGNGLDEIYPREHQGLAEKILDSGGLLLSEYPPGTPPLKHQFPARNRIIAALSQGILVIQARENSGSLITANMALDLGREVFILPGPYNDPSFAGGHSLVQQGAKLIQRVSDIVCDLKLDEKFFFENSLKLLIESKGGTMTLEEIFSATHLPLGEILAELEELKARNEVIELNPQEYSLITMKDSTQGLSLAATSKQ